MLKALTICGFTAAASLLMIVGVSSEANATTITISSCYTGSCGSLTGSITVDINADSANANPGAGDVKVVVTNGTNGFIDEIGLLYNGGLPSDTQIESFSAVPNTITQPSFTLAVCQNDNSNQALNNCQDYASSNAARFDAGGVVTFFLDSDLANILASSFLTSGAYAHIQEIGGGSGSAKITSGGGSDVTVVPEPATLTLLGTGLAFAYRARRRKGVAAG